MKRMITCLVLIIVQMNVLLAQSGQPISLTATLTDSQCNAENGLATGSIDLMVSGGTAPYQYIWSEGSVTEDLSNLDVSLYCVTVTDSEGNTKNDCYDIGGPDPITIAGVGTNPHCHHLNGSLTGALDVTIYGGTPPYSFEWQGPGITQGIEDQYSLGEGTYSILVTDANGCTNEGSYTLVEPEELTLDSQVMQPECIDGEQILGSVNLIPFGGMPPYTYYWTGPGVNITAMNQSNLSEGAYNVTVTDSNGCTVAQSFEIESSDTPLVVEPIVNNINCTNGNLVLGSIELNITGGITPYSFMWSENVQDVSVQNQSNLSAGTYNVTVTDAEGCQYRSLEFEIGTEGVASAPNLCLITNDNAEGHNHLYWESDESAMNIAQYHIYREGSASNEFELIGSVAVEGENSFMDAEANSTQQAYRYYVTAANACDVESEPSAIHKTIHLTINQGVNGNINLIWDEYEGVEYEQVTIYRGDSENTMTEYLILPGNISSFTDLNALTGASYYQIGLTLPISCDIGKGNYELRSNIAINTPNNIEEVSWLESIAPNPFRDQLHIELEQSASVQISDTSGRIILSKKLKQGHNAIDTQALANGIYLVKLISGNQVTTWKGVK